MPPYSFETTGRNRKTLIALGIVWGAIAGAVFWLEASLVVMGVIALCTAPALYDVIAGRRAGVALGTEGLSWFAGKRTGDIAWDKIRHLRFDTRLDFSVRTSAVLVSGRKVRLPLESTPHPLVFQNELSARGIAFEQHHFSLLG